jgi:hypothetical protein
MICTRRAVSLVELLVVMSACTVVLTLSSVLLVRAMRIQMQSRVHCDIERNSLRLSNQFRRDAHEAKSVRSSRDELEGDTVLRIHLTNGKQVEYSYIAGRVVRLSTENGKYVSREEFTFPATCELSVRELESPPRISLTIATNQDLAAPFDGVSTARSIAPPVSLHVEGRLGRDRRASEMAGVVEVIP